MSPENKTKLLWATVFVVVFALVISFMFTPSVMLINKTIKDDSHNMKFMGSCSAICTIALGVIAIVTTAKLCDRRGGFKLLKQKNE